MPPKKKAKQLTEQQKIRRAYNRQRSLGSTPAVVQDARKLELFASFGEKPEFNLKKKKAPAPRKVFPPSPDISVEPVSSDDEDAGNFKIPEAGDDEEEELRKLQAEHNCCELSSLDAFDDDGDQVDFVDGRLVKRAKQPDAAWKPGIREDYVGNYPMQNRPAKKMKHDLKKKDENQLIRRIVSKPAPALNFYQSLCRTLQATKAKQVKKAALEEKIQLAQKSFRVFGTPTKEQNKFGNRKEATEVNERLSMFNYTPLRGNRMEAFENSMSTELIFSPKLQNASTPLEKKPQSRKTGSVPVFNHSDNDDSENHEKVEEVVEHPSVLSEKELTLKTAAVRRNNAETAQSDAQPSINITKENEILFTSQNQSAENEDVYNATPSINRKAETSVTELLDEAEVEESCQPNQEDTKYAKKRQRTKSPETMCQGMSTVMTMQNDPGMSTVMTMQNDGGMSTVMTMQDDQEDQLDFVLEMEKENAAQKRGTLQPQQRQLARESRISRLSVMSAASSYHDTINSAMEEMSLDQKHLEETMGEDGGRSQLIESRVDSRILQTGMTIHNEDPSLLPFYLADGTFEVAPSTMAQLLHVAGQKEAKTWASLPKTALDGRRVKKLGEGSYGEVFSTIWEGKPVAIKVVPFEADDNNRLYTGEYHSERMQTADQILPELIVMKELNQLKNMASLHSTPNFIELIAAKIVTGNYPKGLLKAWDTYTATVKESENTRPDIYSSNDQKFIVIVSANGGVALEDFVLKSENEMLSILHQLILSMLAAESLLEFEHRDLHLGNVLIDRSGVDELDYMIGGHKIPLKAHGVKVNIIDFTLSRISKGPTTVFLDLENDPGVFEGAGDPQFDVYRQMRTNCNGNWIKFENRTNLMWIEYIAHCLIDTEFCPEGMLTKKRKEELRQLFKQLGQFESCQASLMDTEFYEKFYIGYFGDVAKPQEDIYSDSE